MSKMSKVQTDRLEEIIAKLDALQREIPGANARPPLGAQGDLGTAKAALWRFHGNFRP